MCSSDCNRYSKLIAACTFNTCYWGCTYFDKWGKGRISVTRWIDSKTGKKGSPNTSFAYLKCVLAVGGPLV